MELSIESKPMPWRLKFLKFSVGDHLYANYEENHHAIKQAIWRMARSKAYGHLEFKTETVKIVDNKGNETSYIKVIRSK